MKQLWAMNGSRAGAASIAAGLTKREGLPTKKTATLLLQPLALSLGGVTASGTFD